MHNEPGKTIPLRQATLIKCLTHNGLVYSNASATYRDSLAIVSLSSNEKVPAQIQYIFTAYQEYSIFPKPLGLFICIKLFSAAASDIEDPFREFPIWNACLYIKTPAPELCILPVSAIQCHFAQITFDNSHNLIVPLDRVCFRIVS